MTILLTTGTLCVLAYIIYAMSARFMEATGTVYERLCAAVQGSATVAVSYASGALLAVVTLLDDLPEVRDHIQTLVPEDKWKYVALVIVIVTYIARKRTL